MGDSKSKYTNIKLRGKGPSKFQVFLKITFGAATVLFAAGAIYTAIKSANETEKQFIAVESLHGTIDELSNPQAFVAAYVSANASGNLLPTIHTLRAFGTVDTGGIVENFTLIKQKPDRSLFILDRKTYKMTFGVSDDTVWRRIRTPQREDTYELLEGVEADVWKNQRRFFNRIIEVYFGYGRIISISPEIYERKECLKVTTTDPSTEIVDIFVDLETMLAIAEQKETTEGTLKETRFDDYRDVNGLQVPFKMTTTVAGEIVTQVILEEVKLNSGIISTLFEMPESAL